MKKAFLCIFFAAALSAGCSRIEIERIEPEHPTVTLTATLESEATKTYLDDSKYVCWADGDEVWINGETYTVAVSGSTATIAGVTKADNYACVYPSSAVSSHDGAKVKFTLPQTQTITYDASGRQVLTLPMAAYGDGSSALQFKNLCGLMAVTVSNTDKDAGLTPTGIKISTSDGPSWTASLWGTTGSARDLSDGSDIDDSEKGWAILASNIGGSGDRTELEVTVSGGPAIAKGSSATYYVTVPVIDEGTRSKISVEMSGTIGSNSFIFNKKTSSSVKTIGRNQLGAIPVSSSLCYEIKTSGTDWNGSGTENDPWQISCTDHWIKLADMAFAKELTSDMYFLQVCDIDCASAAIKPVGGHIHCAKGGSAATWQYLFNGHFNGGGHSLKNVRFCDIDYFPIVGESFRGGTIYCYSFGLFPCLEENAEIKNLSVTYQDASFTHEKAENVGGIVGNCTGITVLENLSCSGSVTWNLSNNSTYVGGVIGKYKGGTIDNLSFDGTLEVNFDSNVLCVGGIVGYILGAECEISNFSTGEAAKINVSCPDLVSHAYIGGLIGELPSTFNCEGVFANRAEITCSANDELYVGGVAGSLNTDYESGSRTCASLSNAGRITAVTTSDNCGAGGLFGYFYDDDWEYAFVNCSNSGAVKATGASDAYAGGFAGRIDGHAVSIDKFTNSGKIEAYAASDAKAGGIAGVDDDGTFQSILNVYNSENRGEIIAQSTGNSNAYAGGLVGEHDSDGLSSSLPCFINCCNRGAVRAGGNDIYIGGLLGKCYDTDTTIGASFALADLAYLGDTYSDLYYGGISGKEYTHVKNWWKLVTGAISGANRLTPSFAYPDAGTHYQADEDASDLVSNLNGAWSGALDAIKDSKLTGYTPTQVTWKVDGDYPALDLAPLFLF